MIKDRGSESVNKCLRRQYRMKLNRRTQLLVTNNSNYWLTVMTSFATHIHTTTETPFTVAQAPTQQTTTTTVVVSGKINNWLQIPRRQLWRARHRKRKRGKCARSPHKRYGTCAHQSTSRIQYLYCFRLNTILIDSKIQSLCLTNQPNQSQ